MKKALKIVGRIFAGLLILVVALILLLPLYGPSTASRILSSQLNTAVALDRLSLSLVGGRLALGGLRMAQPKGFGPGDLLELGALDVELKTSSLWKKPIRIERVAVEGLRVSVVRNKEGVMNVQALAPPSGKPAEEKAPAPAKEAPEASKETILVLESLTLANSMIQYADASLGDKPLEMVLTNVQVRVERLQVGGLGEPAKITVRLELVQPEQDAQLLVLAKVGPVGAGVSAVISAVRVVGLELGPLGEVVPPGVPQMLGGDALDLSVDAAVEPEKLAVDILVTMAGGNTYRMPIGGTLEAPEFDQSSVLFGVAGRLGGGVGNLAMNLGKGGVTVAKSVVGTAGKIGGGALDTVGSAGSGLAGMAKGLVTGDLGKMGDGLKQATVGTVKEAGGAVKDGALHAADGVMQAGDHVGGGAQGDAWRAGQAKRWEEAETSAAKYVEQ